MAERKYPQQRDDPRRDLASVTLHTICGLALPHRTPAWYLLKVVANLSNGSMQCSGEWLTILFAWGRTRHTKRVLSPSPPLRCGSLLSQTGQ